MTGPCENRKKPSPAESDLLFEMATVLAVRHPILVVAYPLLKRGVASQELGEDFLERLTKNPLARYLVKRLENLGHKVTLEPYAA